MKICGLCGVEYPDSRGTCLNCGSALRNLDPHGPIVMGSSGTGSYPREKRLFY